MPKQLMFDDEARKKVRVGIGKLADAVKVTMGPAGRNVILQKSWGSPSITKEEAGAANVSGVPSEDVIRDRPSAAAPSSASVTISAAGLSWTTSRSAAVASVTDSTPE